MRIRMNNKGYMLVEIILAFSITFALVYFMMNLIIDMKNDNDDLLVKTVVTTDQTIITNELMEYAILEKDNFSCNELKISGKSITYRDKVINVLNDYVSVGSISCSNVGNKVTIRIPLSVKQMEDKIFDAFINYRYGSPDVEKPTCTISASANSTTIIATYNDNADVVGYYFGKDIPNEDTEFISMDSSMSGNKTGNISSTGTYYFGFKDTVGNIGYCSGNIVSTTSGQYCPNHGSPGGCYSSSYNATCAGTWNCTTSHLLMPGDCKSKPAASCYSVSKKYSCPSGGSVYGTKCYFWEATLTKYSCSSGYTKLNDSYCYKNN